MRSRRASGSSPTTTSSNWRRPDRMGRGLRAFLLRSRLVFAALVSISLCGSALAAAQTVRLAKQFGISYLPLTIMEKKGLLEAEGKNLGLDLKTEWVQFTGGAPM